MIKQKVYLLACFCIFTFNFHHAFAEEKFAEVKQAPKQAPKQEATPIYQQYPPTADCTDVGYALATRRLKNS